MFARRNFPRSDPADLMNVETLVRAHFALAEDRIVLVGEDDSRLEGGPERMTTILFWTGPDRRHRIRVFKPAAEVADADLPVSWLRGALLDDGEADCC